MSLDCLHTWKKRALVISLLDSTQEILLRAAGVDPEPVSDGRSGGSDSRSRELL